MSIYLNLNSQKIENVNKIIKIPDIEELHTRSGKYYGVKYFLYTSKNLLILRITSSDKSFSTIHSIDVLDKKMIPSVGVIFDKKIPRDVFINMINDMVLKHISKEVQENYLSDLYLTYINEGFEDMFDTPPEGFWPQVKHAWKRTPGFLKLYYGFVGAVLVLTVFMKYRYYAVKLINWIKEKYIEGPVESKLNQELFSSQEKDEPAYKMYSDVIAFIEQIIHGKAPAFIICGPPGMSKTYILKRTFYFEGIKPGTEYKIEKGSGLGIKDVYSMLYYNRKKIVVLDDFDTPLQNPEMVNLLKAITDSYDRRILSMPREKDLGHADTQQAAPAAPSKFEFSGKLIIITNLTRDKIDSALISRCPVYEMKFNSQQIIKSLNSFMSFVNPSASMELKQEVFNYIIKLYKKDPKIEVTFRSFKNSIDARIGNPLDWKNMVHHIVNYKNK